MTNKAKLIVGLLRLGCVERVPSTLKSYRVFTSPDGRREWLVGRSCGLRSRENGEPLKLSRSWTDDPLRKVLWRHGDGLPLLLENTFRLRQAGFQLKGDE